MIKKLKNKIKTMFDEWNPTPNPDHTVWTVEVKAISKVFNTEVEAQKYADKMNRENLFKVKKLDINPTRKPKPKKNKWGGVKPEGWRFPQSYTDDKGNYYQFE